MILTSDERKELTGSCTRKGQIEILKKYKIPFIVRKDGWPAVTWQAVNKETFNEVKNAPNLDW